MTPIPRHKAAFPGDPETAAVAPAPAPAPAPPTQRPPPARPGATGPTRPTRRRRGGWRWRWRRPAAAAASLAALTAAASVLRMGGADLLRARERRGEGAPSAERGVPVNAGAPGDGGVGDGDGEGTGPGDYRSDGPPRLLQLTDPHGPPGVVRSPGRRRERAIPAEGREEDAASPPLVDDAVPPPDISPDCAAPLHAQPACNNIHEIDVPWALGSDLLRKVSKGAVRNVWSVIEPHGGLRRERIAALWKSGGVPYVLKTLRWTRGFIPVLYDRQIREAVALDFMTSSDGTADIYGFCGLTSAAAYAGNGNLADYLRKRTRKAGASRVSPAESLTIAARLARAVADLQDSGRVARGGAYGDDGMALQVIHRDIGPSNVLVLRGSPHMKVVLDDFNQAYILRRYHANLPSENFTCEYRDLFICGEDGRRPDTRSPEECRGSTHLSQSVDTYGMGTVLFYLLTLQRAYSFNSDAPGPPSDFPDWYREHVIKGEEPELPPDVESDDNAAIFAIKKVMREALANDPKKRPSARFLANFLENELYRYRKNS